MLQFIFVGLCLSPKVAFQCHLHLLLRKKTSKISLQKQAWRGADAVYLAIKSGSLQELQDLPSYTTHKRA